MSVSENLAILERYLDELGESSSKGIERDGENLLNRTAQARYLLLYRFNDVASASLVLMKRGYGMPVLVLLRSLIETTAQLNYLSDRLSRSEEPSEQKLLLSFISSLTEESGMQAPYESLLGRNRTSEVFREFYRQAPAMKAIYSEASSLIHARSIDYKDAIARIAKLLGLEPNQSHAFETVPERIISILLVFVIGSANRIEQRLMREPESHATEVLA